jgi:hypothetical protein
MAAHLELARSKMPPNVRGAHDHSSRHRTEILASTLCACFYCGRSFGPDEILEWVDNNQMAL